MSNQGCYFSPGGQACTEEPSTAIVTCVFISIRGGNVSFSVERDSEAHFSIEGRI